MTVPQIPGLSIAVCTFKRPNLLADLLADLSRELTLLAGDARAVEVVVVDNDGAGSAAPLVARHGFARYVHEPDPGIVAARNAAARSVRGAVVLWIDDDQRLAHGTLRAALEAWRRRPNGVGAIRFAVRRWPGPAASVGAHVRHHSFAFRPLARGRVATNGLMVARALLEREQPVFDPAYQRRPGEDVDFYLRALAAGERFALLEDIVLFEVVPPERDSLRYLLRRGFVTGWMDAWFDRRYPTLGAIGSRPSPRLRRHLGRLVFVPLELMRRDPHLLWGAAFRPAYLVGRMVGHRLGGMPPPW